MGINTETFNKIRIIPLILGVLAIVATLICAPMLVENLDSSEIMVIQSPVSGELTVHTEPGLKWQGFGTVTKYNRREQYSFSAAKDQGATVDQSIQTGFNDGGRANISGVVSWEMPLQPEQVVRLHKEYRSFRAIDQQLIRPMLETVIFGTGATMSSFESSSERRPEIPQLINDQLQNGPYLTAASTIMVKDQITGVDKPVRSVSIQMDGEGKPKRASASQIKEYGIVLSPVTVNQIVYEPSVATQIAERQKSTQAVLLSQATAVKATQEAITTEQQGKAKAAEEKWKQEAVNAKEIALAEKDKQVAVLAALTAEQVKRRLILEGEGEAAKKRLVMEADGALDKKLEAYVKVNQSYAEAIKSAAPGAWTPTVQMGGAQSTNSSQALLELFAAKSAKDLGVDLQAAGAAKTTKK